MHLDDDTKTRLNSYLSDIGEILKYPKRKAAFATYIVGLFSTVGRKTAEGLAALNMPDPERVDAEHQRLLHVVGQSKWSDRAVRRYAAEYALKAMVPNGVLDTWVIDDTGWIKKGAHSVGVQRQYTGSSGKIDNCQLGVSLVATTTHAQIPIDFELYLPESWTEEPPKRQKAKIPESLEFQTKPELALKMIDKAIEDDLPRPKAVLADAFYGRSGSFRAAIRERQLHYAVGVRQDMKVRRLDAKGIRRGPATTVANIAKKVEFRCVSWTDGSKGKRSAQFSFLRVVPEADLKEDPEAESLWLVIEKTEDEKDLYKFHVSSLSRWITRKELVRLLHQRWRTERVYQDLKQEFGLDEYQGRSFVGWHHHVTAAMVCYAFTTAEQARLFPPAPRIATNHPSVDRTTGTPFRRVHPHYPQGDLALHTALAISLPQLSPTHEQRSPLCGTENMTQ